jgi:hypothetical protein
VQVLDVLRISITRPDTTLRGALDMAEGLRRAVAAHVSQSPLPRTDRLARHRQTASPGVADVLKLLAAVDAWRRGACGHSTISVLTEMSKGVSSNHEPSHRRHR